MRKSLHQTRHKGRHVLFRQGKLAGNLGRLISRNRKRQYPALIAAQSLTDPNRRLPLNSLLLSVPDARFSSQ